MKHLLLLHGALGSADQFEQLENELKSDFFIHRFNFCGHGGLSFKDNPYSMDAFCDDIQRYMEKNEIKKCNIFGYSMGGYVAIHFALKFPDKVEQIFTLATKFDWNAESAIQESSLLNVENMIQKIPSYVEMLSKLHSPTAWKSVVERTAALMIQLGDDHLKQNDFVEIKCPVRIAVGDKDRMVSIESSLDVSKSIPGGSFLILENTPHPFEKISIVQLKSALLEFF